MDEVRKQALKSSVLNLSYAFVSNPNPIIVSTTGEAPKLVDLTVIISNPHTYPISVDKIEIKIPVGEDSARALSTDPTLPTPVYDTNKLWAIMASGSTVTISSNDSQPLEITDQSISFKLNAITVNDVVGIVPITITEYVTDAAKVSDANAYTLMKLAADYPVTNFYAKPEIFYRNGQSTVLYWDCSEYGQDCVYKVHSDSWRPNIFYSADDGQAGVQSPPLYQTTTFALDIYKSNSDGSRDFIDTLYTTVYVVVPVFYDTKYVAHVNGIERLVKLYWTAVNADYCEIQINEKTYLNNLPTNTNPNGFLLFINQNDVSNSKFEVRIAVIAHAAENSVTATYYVPYPLSISSSVQHVMQHPTASVGGSIYNIAVTPNSMKALVVGMEPKTIEYPYYTIEGKQPYLNIIALDSFQCNALTLNDPSAYCSSTNVTANNQLAYTTINNTESAESFIKTINLDNNKVASTKTQGGQYWLTLTPDNQFLLATDVQFTTTIMGSILSFNTSTLSSPLQQLNSNQMLPYQMAVTPNGQLAFVTNGGSDSVSVFSISNGILTLVTTLNLGGGTANAVAITPDGTLALVTNISNNTMSVIDVATLTVEATIPAGGSKPCSLAVTADSQYAYVLNQGSGTLSLVDIPSCSCVAGSPFTLGGAPVAIALTPNQHTVLVIYNGSNQLTSLANSI